MEEKKRKHCSKCDRTTRRGKLVLCKNIDKLVCHDCCIKSLHGTMGKCIHWGFCWQTWYV